MRRADAAKVRAYQPYLSGKRSVSFHPFALLREINNADKHRTVHPIWDIPTYAHYEVTDQRDCVLSERGSRAQICHLKVDAEVAFIKVRKTGPDPQIEVQPYAEAEPSLEQRVWLQTWLRDIKTAAFLLLTEFSTPPDELDEVGIAWDRLTLEVGEFRFPPHRGSSQ